MSRLATLQDILDTGATIHGLEAQSTIIAIPKDVDVLFIVLKSGRELKGDDMDLARNVLDICCDHAKEITGTRPQALILGQADDILFVTKPRQATRRPSPRSPTDQP